MKKQNMKKQKNSYLLMLILMFLVSCESNLFRIDDKGCIIGNKPINYIEIKSETDNIIYVIQKRKNRKPSKNFCLDNIPSEYVIERYYEKNGFINYKEEEKINLERNKLYKFITKGGDSGEYRMVIFLDTAGIYKKQ